MRQTSFNFIKDYKKEFGGSLLTGKRKTARPLSFKNPTHLILKSTGSNCFVPDSRKIENLINTQANKYGIKIYKFSLNWSHIHMVILLPSKEAYLKFIRTLTSLLVSLLSKLKGKSLKGLFDLRPFTRILSWGRDYRNVLNYHELNDMEARGFNARKKKAKSSKKKDRNSKGISKESEQGKGTRSLFRIKSH
jgi:hypothetical protein